MKGKNNNWYDFFLCLIKIAVVELIALQFMLLLCMLSGLYIVHSDNPPPQPFFPSVPEINLKLVTHRDANLNHFNPFLIQFSPF